MIRKKYVRFYLIEHSFVKVSKAFNIRPLRSRVGLGPLTHGLREKHLDLSQREVRCFS